MAIKHTITQLCLLHGFKFMLLPVFSHSYCILSICMPTLLTTTYILVIYQAVPMHEVSGLFGVLISDMITISPGVLQSHLMESPSSLLIQLNAPSPHAENGSNIRPSSHIFIPITCYTMYLITEIALILPCLVCSPNLLHLKFMYSMQIYFMPYPGDYLLWLFQVHHSVPCSNLSMYSVFSKLTLAVMSLPMKCQMILDL